MPTTSVTIWARHRDMAGCRRYLQRRCRSRSQGPAQRPHPAQRPTSDTASLHLTVTASTSEGTSSAASAAQTINLTVNPVAEAPVLMASAAATSVNEDSNVALNITATPAENDADANDLGHDPRASHRDADRRCRRYGFSGVRSRSRKPSSAASPCAAKPATTPRACTSTVTASASEAPAARLRRRRPST